MSTTALGPGSGSVLVTIGQKQPVTRAMELHQKADPHYMHATTMKPPHRRVTALAAFCLAGFAFDALATCGPQDDALADYFGAAKLEDVRARADGGNAAAQNEMGRRYGVGKDVAKNSEISFSWYEKAATQHFCAAEANLAFMYLNGEGTAKDAQAAKEWSLKAAAQGAPRSQYALGYMYATGVLGKPDGRSAEYWFRKAAYRGDVGAQRVLIRFYESGELVPKDLEEAALWLHRVRDAGAFGDRKNDRPTTARTGPSTVTPEARAYRPSFGPQWAA